jgi:hypothetical protein
MIGEPLDAEMFRGAGHRRELHALADVGTRIFLAVYRHKAEAEQLPEGANSNS